MVTHGDYAWFWTRWRSQFQANFVFDIIYIHILICLILIYAYLYIYMYSWLLKTYLWFSWPRMIVDFQSNGSTIPTFPKSSTTLVESFSASRHRKKNSNYCLFKLLVQRFVCFVHRKITINCFHYILLSLMFSHVSVCLGIFPFFHPKMASNWKFLAEAMLQRPRKSKVSVFCLRRSRAEKHGENGEKKIVVQYSRRVWEVDAHHLICYPLHISVFRSLRTSPGSKMFSVELHIVTSWKSYQLSFPAFSVIFRVFLFFLYFFLFSCKKIGCFPLSHKGGGKCCHGWIGKCLSLPPRIPFRPSGAQDATTHIIFATPRCGKMWTSKSSSMHIWTYCPFFHNIFFHIYIYVL